MSPQLFVIDAGGRHAWLCDAVPGATRLRLGVPGAGGASINPFDVDDVSRVPPAKRMFLLRLLALLLAEDVPSSPARELVSLRRELLRVAVRTVYARAGDARQTPSLSLLRTVLDDLAAQAAADPRPSQHHARGYAQLARRLRDVCAIGPLADALDRPTNVSVDGAAFVVLDTSQIPGNVSAAVMLCILEFVTGRAARAGGRPVSLLADVIDAPVDDRADVFPPAFPGDTLLDALHVSYMRRRERAGEARAIAYLHAISDVAHFLHPPTALSRADHSSP